MTPSENLEFLPPASRRRLSKKPLLLGLAVLVAVAFVALSWLFVAYHGQLDLERAIAEADAEEPNWRLVDLEAHVRPAVPDAENGALVVIAANALMPAGWPSWPVPEAKGDTDYEIQVRRDLEESLEDLSPPVQLNERQVAALRAELKRAALALDKARTLVNFPTGRYRVTWTPDFISTLLPDLQKVRFLAKLLGYDAQLRAQEGDLDGSLLSCRAVLNAGRSVGDEQLLISQLVRIACAAVAVRSIERTLAQGQASEASLALLQRLLAEEAEEPLLLYGVRGERAGCDGLLELIQHRQFSFSQLRGLMRSSPAFGGSFSLEDVKVALLMASAKSQRAGMLHFMNELVQAAKLPPEQQRQRLIELDKSLPSRPGLVGVLAPALVKVSAACNRACAENRAAAVALAVERYRLAHGRWPAALGDLVPKYLTKVPTDPFDGKPLRYLPFNEGVVVYSVSADGVDNHGNISKNPSAPGSDIGFRLWSLPHRRRPAKSFEMPPRPSTPPFQQ